MPGPLANTALPSLEGQDVTGTTQGIRGCGGVGEGAAREGAVVGGDAGGDGGVVGVDGEGVGGAAGVLALRDHLGEFEGFGAGGEDGGAHEAGGVADHEGELFGCGVLGGEDEIGFVFAAGVV